jgi:hypothetical protein
MNYVEWAEEYRENALRIQQVIKKKQRQLNGKHLSADLHKRLTDEIKAYRRIFYELCQVEKTLLERAGGSP